MENKLMNELLKQQYYSNVLKALEMERNNLDLLGLTEEEWKKRFVALTEKLGLRYPEKQPSPAISFSQLIMWCKPKTKNKEANMIKLTIFDSMELQEFKKLPFAGGATHTVKMANGSSVGYWIIYLKPRNWVEKLTAWRMIRHAQYTFAH